MRSDDEVLVFDNDRALVSAAAGAIAEHIETRVADSGTCRIALAGGSTPQPVYQRLAAMQDHVEFAKVEWFFGDERCVPPDDDASNYAMARDMLLKPVGAPTERIHRIKGERPAQEAAAAYQTELGDEPLDLVLLGMGTDGHTASLFPGSAELESDQQVVATQSPIPPHDRVSLTLKTINAARAVLFIVSGPAKARRVAEVMAEIDAGTCRLPAARVKPTQGKLQWFLDESAAHLMRARTP